MHLKLFTHGDRFHTTVHFYALHKALEQGYYQRFIFYTMPGPSEYKAGKWELIRVWCEKTKQAISTKNNWRTLGIQVIATETYGYEIWHRMGDSETALTCKIFVCICFSVMHIVQNLLHPLLFSFGWKIGNSLQSYSFTFP